MTALARLRPYQLPVARAVIADVIAQRGNTFVCRMSRQAGKNETSAQLEAGLLGIANAGVLAQTSLSIVKAAPTLNPQTKRSRRRLISTLTASGTRYRLDDALVYVGDAWASFASGEPNANVVGDTAGLLLEVDEAQDFDIDTYDKKFAPMRAAENASAILWGTAWSDVDLLERERLAALRAQELDGIRRVFDVDWREVARSLPAYGTFANSERARLGSTHPMFITQYELQTLAGEGKLLSPDMLTQLAGQHSRATAPPATARIVAGLDIAGGHDASGSHDRTVLTLGAVTPSSPADPIQANHLAVLHHIAWRAVDHMTLLPQIRDLVQNVWRVRKLAVDATGIGETIARVLTATLGEHIVEAVNFHRASKSALGFELIETAATGRLKLYLEDSSPESITCWDELTKCRRELLPGQLIDWRVPEDEGNDDYVTSLALCTRAANLYEHRVARGRSPS